MRPTFGREVPRVSASWVWLAPRSSRSPASAISSCIARSLAHSGQTEIAVLQAILDGETRTRTGDSTILSRAVSSLELARNRCKQAAFGGYPARPRIRKFRSFRLASEMRPPHRISQWEAGAAPSPAPRLCSLGDVASSELLAPCWSGTAIGGGPVRSDGRGKTQNRRSRRSNPRGRARMWLERGATGLPGQARCGDRRSARACRRRPGCPRPTPGRPRGRGLWCRRSAVSASSR